MYFLKRLPDGSYALNKHGRQLINQFYPPPKQHGKKHLEAWLKEGRQKPGFNKDKSTSENYGTH